MNTFIFIVLAIIILVVCLLLILPIYLYAKGRRYLTGPVGPMGPVGAPGWNGIPGEPGRSVGPEETRRIVQQVLDKRDDRNGLWPLTPGDLT